MKHYISILLLCFAFSGIVAQNLTVESVNEFNNPQFRDFIGVYAYGDTLFVKGSYDGSASSLTISLLTFRKSPWERTDSYALDLSDQLTGIIDTFLVVPDAYTLYIPGGDTANSQMLQVRGSFPGGDEFTNLLLEIIEEHPVHKSLIDFDEVYGISSGQTLVNNINTATSTMRRGDTLLFKSTEYDFEGKSLTLSTGIYLTGALPTYIKKDTVGAYDVKSTFRNMKNFHIRASDMNLANMRFIPVDSIGYVFSRFSHSTQGMYYTNIHVNNVIFENGKVQCYGGNGAGIEFRNVSFLNFEHGGFNCNRSFPTDEKPRNVIKRCKFVPNWNEVFYNTRGVSMDAGNDNHPVVWDMNEMLIDSCFFDGNGVGWSKGKNAAVTNCHFIGYRGDVDMIHMEEFTSHIHIENNLFEYNKPSRTFYLDRNLQPAHDITIINNTFKGEYKWVFWCNSPRNLRFENNDMTEASASDPAAKTFDFTDHQSGAYEAAPYDHPIEHLVIRNNPGINKTAMGVMSIHELNGDTTNIIEDYPASKILRNVVNTRPLPLLDTMMIYRISNESTNEAVSAVQSTSQVKLNSDEVLYSNELWQVEFIYPYNYTFKNLNSGNYMEVYKIYTLGDYEKDEDELPIIYIEQKSDYADRPIPPHFFLSEVNGRGSGLFQLFPGTNEKKSRLIKRDDRVVLNRAKIVKANNFKPADASSTWKFEEMKEWSSPDNIFPIIHKRYAKDTVLASENTVRHTLKDYRTVGDTLFTDSITIDSTFLSYTIHDIVYTDSVFREYTSVHELSVEIPYHDTLVSIIDTVTSYIITSTEIVHAYDLRFFPNPAREELNILLPPGMKNSSIRISDISGRSMLQMNASAEHIQIDVSSLTGGQYLLQLYNGDTQFSTRILIE